MDKEKLNWRSFADPRGEKDDGYFGRISAQWNLEGTPTLYVLDHKGVIRYKWLGPSEKVIDEALAKLLQEVDGDGKDKAK